jgi:hypothetical protein
VRERVVDHEIDDFEGEVLLTLSAFFGSQLSRSAD